MLIGQGFRRDRALDTGIYRLAIHRPLALELIRRGAHHVRPCGEQRTGLPAAVIDALTPSDDEQISDASAARLDRHAMRLRDLALMNHDDGMPVVRASTAATSNYGAAR